MAECSIGLMESGVWAEDCCQDEWEHCKLKVQMSLYFEMIG
jgi:hypothetical protein